MGSVKGASVIKGFHILPAVHKKYDSIIDYNQKTVRFSTIFSPILTSPGGSLRKGVVLCYKLMTRTFNTCEHVLVLSCCVPLQDISCNEITALPRYIGRLKTLRELNVRRNLLCVLPEGEFVKEVHLSKA